MVYCQTQKRGYLHSKLKAEKLQCRLSEDLLNMLIGGTPLKPDCIHLFAGERTGITSLSCAYSQSC